MIFPLKINHEIRIERSIAINGHFYLRLRSTEDEFTLGFGYETLSNSLVPNEIMTFVQLAYTVIEPVENKWVKYLNDYPQNPKFLPNKYHICTNWIKISNITATILNDVINGNNYYDFFQLSFSSVVFKDSKNIKKTNNCRTILLDLIKDSLSTNAFLTFCKFFEGNPTWNDIRYGCLYLQIEDSQAILKSSHPCGNSTNECCKHVTKTFKCERIPICEI